jgi:predicted DNA-binding WGR domain protein
MTLLHRRDPTRNMARFYAMAYQGDLLDGWGLVREWGRIGGPGRVRVDPHGELETARMAAEQLGVRKRKRGYVG